MTVSFKAQIEEIQAFNKQGKAVRSPSLPLVGPKQTEFITLLREHPPLSEVGYVYRELATPKGCRCDQKTHN